MIKKFLTTKFLFFGIVQIAIASSVSCLQTYLDQWAEKNEIVGASLAINDELFFYGYSDKSSLKLVAEKTQFGIGSITKTFVSVALLKLESQDKLDIHDSITKYLPQYPKLKNVTIQSLMQMSAGFNDAAKISATLTQQIDLAYATYNPQLAGNWLYSNVSYQLLGILIEKITGQALSKVISDLITSPLHLNSIYFPGALQARTLKEYQNGHVKISNFANAYAAGGLVSNAKDLASFIRHLFVIKDLLPEKQYKELTTFKKTSEKYYAFTGMKAPQFGLGVFKQDISPYGEVLTYPGVLSEGFTSAYTVVGKNVIIAQSNSYNHNDFSILWSYRPFTKGLMSTLN